MELYLLRHGAAEDRWPGGSDQTRRLTADGIVALRENLNRAAARGVRPVVILSSPYQRAMETAEIAMEILRCEGPILLARALEPDSSPTEVWNEVRLHRDVPSVLVVSHEPLLSSALAWLTGATEAVTSFAAGSLARLNIDVVGAAPRASIGWLPGLLD